MRTKEGGMKTRIEIGDRVNVHWEHIESEWNCEVLYVPMSEGDSWHLRRENGTIVDVQHYGKMEIYVAPLPKPEIDLGVF
jgi:hypothetical protein